MSNTILKIENLSKQYRLGTIGTGTISHDLNRWWHKVRGKEDPFLKVGETNDRATKGTSEYVWALKDINFEVKKGEVLGIIGKNGAGKSTLLKILSKVTGPTTGSIKSKGRIASLLEVGTGFHPEMTGRENIYLNGAILGMTKKEINQKLEEIIEFSGCQRYIDTPVKRYSSGMRVRLAFAVAAFLEPDILVIDEVLAVGDAEFQKKAIGKMQDISRGEGRTVLFVSHDMAAVRNLCTKVIVLTNGDISFSGETYNAIDYYLNNNLEESFNKSFVEFDKNNRKVYLKSVMLLGEDNKNKNLYYMDDDVNIVLEIENLNNIFLNNIKASVLVLTDMGVKVVAIRSHEMIKRVLKSNSSFELYIKIKSLKLMPRNYLLTVAIAVEGKTIDLKNECIGFTILPTDIFNTGKIPKGNFINYSNAIWKLKEK